MLNYLILPVIALACLLLSYVLAQDIHADANRLFAAFMGIAALQGCFNLVRLTTRDEALAYAMSQTLGLTIALGQWLLMLLILVLFLPNRYDQRSVRRLISLPYVIFIAALLLDLVPGQSLWLAGTKLTADGTFDVVLRQDVSLLLIGLIIANLVPIMMLGTIAVRHKDRRAPAIILGAGCLFSLVISSIPPSREYPVLYIINAVPIYVAFAWITLQYQIFRPSPIALQTAIESLPEGVVFLDREQRVVFANPTGRRYLQLASVEAAPLLDTALDRANLQEIQRVEQDSTVQTRYIRNAESAQVFDGMNVPISGDRKQFRLLLLRDISVDEQRTVELQAALGEVERRAAEQQRLIGEISQQQIVIRELSVPVLPVTHDTIVMPLVGAMDTERLQQLQERALKAIEQSRARRLILDITGVPVFDTVVALGVVQVVQAGQLLGASVALVGVRPEVAQTIVGLGLHLDRIATFATLQEAIAAGGRRNLSYQKTA